MLSISLLAYTWMHCFNGTKLDQLSNCKRTLSENFEIELGGNKRANLPEAVKSASEWRCCGSLADLLTLRVRGEIESLLDTRAKQGSPGHKVRETWGPITRWERDWKQNATSLGLTYTLHKYNFQDLCSSAQRIRYRLTTNRPWLAVCSDIIVDPGDPLQIKMGLVNFNLFLIIWGELNLCARIYRAYLLSREPMRKYAHTHTHHSLHLQYSLYLLNDKLCSEGNIKYWIEFCYNSSEIDNWTLLSFCHVLWGLQKRSIETARNAEKPLKVEVYFVLLYCGNKTLFFYDWSSNFSWSYYY